MVGPQAKCLASIWVHKEQKCYAYYTYHAQHWAAQSKWLHRKPNASPNRKETCVQTFFSITSKICFDLFDKKLQILYNKIRTRHLENKKRRRNFYEKKKIQFFNHFNHFAFCNARICSDKHYGVCVMNKIPTSVGIFFKPPTQMFASSRKVASAIANIQAKRYHIKNLF